MKLIDMFKKKSITLYEVCLFFLVFGNRLSSIEIFSELPVVAKIVNMAELVLYAIIFFLMLQKKYSLKTLCCTAVIGILLAIGYLYSGLAAFLRALILILSAQGVHFRKILRSSRWALTANLILSTVLYMLGVSDSGVFRRDAIALGYTHPNVAAQVMMLILLFWIMELGHESNWKHYLLVFISAAVIYMITASRTSVVVLIAVPFLLEIIRHMSRFEKTIEFIASISQLGMFAFSYITAMLWPYSMFVQKLDKILVTRIYLNCRAITSFGIPLFGQQADIRADGYTLDTSYISCLVLMGLVATAIFALGYILVVRKAARNKDYALIAVAIAICVYGFFETHTLEIYNNIIYFYILAIGDGMVNSIDGKSDELEQSDEIIIDCKKLLVTMFRKFRLTR